jgi:DNA-directed RNA polymerase specialized sigma24 family protein
MSCEPTTSDLRAALAELDPAYRELYALRAFERLSDEEIAERLSLQQVIVGPLVGRAHRKLCEILARRQGSTGRGAPS